MINTELITVRIPEQANIIVGQSHFIKTVEDISEIITSSVPEMKYGLAFCEASCSCLIRHAGNDAELKKVSVENAKNIGAGHIFILLIKNGFPINILDRLKNCAEVCRIFCATANPLQVLVAKTDQGRGIIGVIDGFSPKGVENAEDIEERKDLLRKFKYKF